MADSVERQLYSIREMFPVHRCGQILRRSSSSQEGSILPSGKPVTRHALYRVLHGFDNYDNNILQINIEPVQSVVNGRYSTEYRVYVPCNLETSRSLQTACHAVCRLRGHRFNGSFYNFFLQNFIVLYCVRNWEGISVVENLVRHNNRSFCANKLVIVSPNYKQENE